MKTIDDLKIVLIDSNLNVILETLDTFNVNEQDKFGSNILHYYLINFETIKIPFKEFIEKLIDLGFDIDKKQSSGVFKRSPLHLIVQLNLREVFDFLINKDVDVDSVDGNGNTILSTAVINYNKDKESYGHYISVLLKNNADPGIENAYGVSALSLSRDISNSDVGRYFI